MGQLNCSSPANEETDKTPQPLSPQEIDNIKSSWQYVVKSGLSINGVNMMIKIFVEHKELKTLWRFAPSLNTTEQMYSNQALKMHGEKLFNAVDMVVNNLQDFQLIVPIIVQLGFSHYRWGAREKHFPVIGESLIGTLQDCIKDHFTDKVKKSWLRLFGLLVFYMTVGMNQARQEGEKTSDSADPPATAST